MSEFVQRALTGTAYVLLTLGAAWAGPLTTTLLFLPVCMIAAREMHRLDRANDPGAPSVVVSMIAAAIVYLVIALSAFVPGIGLPTVAVVAILVAFAAIVVMVVRVAPAPSRDLGHLMTLLLYIALPFGLVTHFLDGGPEKFISFMFLLWTNDTGAYLVGRVAGRTKLLPSVSPKKTVEGLLGGIALTLFVAWLLAQAWPVLSLSQWLACALVVSVTATFGDLLESALKRAAGVKDSGRVLPGHGGILDRFDGFLLAAPAMLACIAVMR